MDLYYQEKNGATHAIHIDSVGKCPCILIRFDKSVGQRFWKIVELDELFDACQHFVIFFCAAVETQHDGRNVSENSGAHQSWINNNMNELINNELI